MNRSGSTLTAFLAAMATLAAPAGAQPQGVTTLSADVTMTTSRTGRSVAILGKRPGSTETLFLFCADVMPGGQTISYHGPARVLYKPQPIPNLPGGIKISGPENVASTLAVVPTSGKSWMFVSRTETPLLAQADPARAGGTVVGVTMVRRLDWAGPGGARRGTDVEGCLASGG